MSKPKVAITLQHWDSTCSDGCCSDHGINITVNGTEVTNYGNQDHILIRSILEHLGYEVIITGLDEDGEESWMG